jgi:ankyrin repeat protein
MSTVENEDKDLKEEDEEDDEEEEDEKDKDLNMEEREIVRKMIFEDKPVKTSEGRTIYDNIITCLRNKMLTKEEKITEVQGILDNITDPEVLKMAVNRGFQSSPQVSPTPLFIAAEKGYSDIVALLLSKGADITESVKLTWGKYTGKKNEYKYFVTPLFVAAMKGHEDIVKLLLAKHTEIVPRLKLRYDNNDSRNVKLVFKDTSIDRVDYSSWEWDKEEDQKKTPTPLFVAAYAGHCNIIKLLVEDKANINWQDDDGMTALWLATEFGELETVKCLLEQGANPNITTKDYYREFSNGSNKIDVTLITPLFMAITRDDEVGDVNFQIIKLLLENNAKVDEPVKQNDSGWTVNITPLYIAVQIAKRSIGLIERRTSLINIIKLLLTYGADINFKDSKPHPQRRLPFSPLSIVEGDNELKDLLLNFKGEPDFKVMTSVMALNHHYKQGNTSSNPFFDDNSLVNDLYKYIKGGKKTIRKSKKIVRKSKKTIKKSKKAIKKSKKKSFTRP